MRRTSPVRLMFLLPRLLPWFLFLPLCINLRPGTVTLALMGDIMLGRGIASVYANKDSAGWRETFAALDPYISSADLALANLESPLTAAPLKDETPFDLRASPESIVALTSAGIDLLSIANNHALDSGLAGLRETQNYLIDAGMAPIGPDAMPVYKTIHGLTMAFFAFDDLSAPLDLATVVQAVQRAWAEGAIVVVSIHWGREYLPAPEPRQVEIAQKLADAEAAVIWGHHPHVLQPVAWVQAEGKPHRTLVAYSLGNALFDQHTPPDAKRSALLLVTINGEGVQDIEAIPFEIDPVHGAVRIANEKDADLILRRLGALVEKFDDDKISVAP